MGRDINSGRGSGRRCAQPLEPGEHRPYTNPMLQSLAVQVFHGDERVSLEFIDVVHRATVGMLERRGGLSFALEAVQSLPILGQSLGRNFKATARLSLVSWAL